MKLALGTVQFGLNYGINNFNGQVTSSEVAKILKYAEKQGISVLDTAAVYGESETILGESDILGFKVVSKLPPCLNDEIEVYFKNSLRNLRVSSLYGYLFHDFNSYKKNPKQLNLLQRFQNDGLVKKIGFSLYHPYELEFLFESNVKFDLVQIPYNLLDRRFQVLLSELSSRGIEVHSRSVFLQGIFFKDLKCLPKKLEALKPYLKDLNQIALKYDTTMFEMALNFVLTNSGISKVIIGIDSLEQLKQNIFACSKSVHVDFISDVEEIIVEQQELLLPSNW